MLKMPILLRYVPYGNDNSSDATDENISEFSDIEFEIMQTETQK